MRRRLFVGLIAAVGLSACDETNPAQPDTEPQMAVVPVSVAAAPAISTLTITVSASDIASDLVFNVTMTNGEATDTITIPAGSDRTITVRGYDASNIETHRGSKTVNLTEGVNPQLTVVLEGLTGDQPLVVALGETTVTVSPETATASVGGTTQLAAVVTDEAGDTLAVSVRWASSHPAVATVDDAGLVSGVSTGTASIIATYGGVGASAAVTVSDAVFPTEGLVAWYPFNGGSPLDESGNEHHYTDNGSAPADDRFGTAASAISFPNFSDELTRTWPEFPAEAFTVSVWVKMDGAFDYNAFSYFEWGEDYVFNSGGHGITIGLDANWTGRQCPTPDEGYVMYVYHGSGALAWEADGCTPYDVFAEWNHVVVTSDRGLAAVYWNGDLLGTFSYATPLPSTTTTSWVGNHDNNTNALPTRFVDDLGIWNRALTSEEIAYLANN